MKNYEELGLPAQREVLGTLVGFWHTEVGGLNKVVHIWGFRDYEHMAEAKAQVAADPDWTEKYLPRVRSLIVSQKTYIMLSPDFAPQP